MLGPDAPRFDQEAHDKMFKEMVDLATAKKKVKEETGDDGCSLGEARIIEYLNEEEEGEKNDNNDWGLKALVEDMRGKFEGLEDVYVWHALCGAWGGVRPGTMERHHLKANVVEAKMAPGLERTMHDLAVVMVEKGGIGLVDPGQAVDLYEGMHSYLAKAGITGVKVDVIHVSSSFILYRQLCNSSSSTINNHKFHHQLLLLLLLMTRLWANYCQFKSCHMKLHL